MCEIVHIQLFTFPDRNKCITVFFNFKILKNEELQIQLKQSTTIVYLSYLLTHSQRLNGNFDAGKNHFINISSYFSKRLFDSISTSLNRIQTQMNENHSEFFSKIK